MHTNLLLSVLGAAALCEASAIHVFSNHTLSTNATAIAGAPSGATAVSVTASGFVGNGTAAPTNTPQRPTDPHTITAHPDGQCAQSLKGGATNTFHIRDGFPNVTTIHSPTFPGAEAQTGGGFDVWWFIPQPPQGCRTQVLLPFTQAHYTPGLPQGNEIINVGSAGCYFGNVPVAKDLLLSFCCGIGDCKASALNSTTLYSDALSKRHETSAVSEDGFDNMRSSSLPRVEPSVRKPTFVITGSGAGAAEQSTHSESLSTGPVSLSKRFYYPPPPAPPTDTGCNIKAGTPFSRAGPQILIPGEVSCTSDPCTVSVSFTVSYQTTFTSSTSQTITNSVGASLSVTGGITEPFTLTTTASLNTDWSKAVETATSQAVSTGNTSSITTTIGLKLGNSGGVTFTPSYICWSGPIDCGKGPSDPIDFCQPDLSGQNGNINGIYSPLVSDSL